MTRPGAFAQLIQRGMGTGDLRLPALVLVRAMQNAIHVNKSIEEQEEQTEKDLAANS